MSKVILDTMTVSELRKEDGMDSSVKLWQSQLRMDDIWLSVVSVMEIRIGYLRILKRDRDFSERLKRWLETTVIPLFADRMLDIDLAIADEAAEMREIYGLSPNDSFIAATAKTRGLTLATRNVSDFVGTGINLINPWDIGK
jgi:toxin FitB